jgi:hypothetical protein
LRFDVAIVIDDHRTGARRPLVDRKYVLLSHRDSLLLSSPGPSGPTAKLGGNLRLIPILEAAA